VAGGSGKAERVTKARIGLLTGQVGVGKTTVAERVVGQAMRQGTICAGLLASAMKNSCGQKAGIWGADIATGKRKILARTDRDLGGPSIGPYSFDSAALDWAMNVLESAVGNCDLLIVDEIGKLELWQNSGLAPFLPKLASGKINRSLVLIRDFLLEDLQNELDPVDQVVFRVTEENRNRLGPLIVEGLLQ
jgi:nucleoside-triphosphatase THEP1